MSPDERELGKRKVEQMIAELCAEAGAGPPSAIEWHKDFDRMQWWLRINISDREVTVPISYENLEDCVHDRGIERKIERFLRQSVIPTPPDTNRIAQVSHDMPQIEGTAPEVFDVFICHATEDKSYVEPLAEALRHEGIKVWYDRFVVSWGDDIRQSIDAGLARTTFGIVIFSPAFLKKKKWTEHELSGLFARESAGRKLILPIWHNIAEDDFAEYGPSFATRLAKNSAKDSISDIVAELKQKLSLGPSPTQTTTTAPTTIAVNTGTSAADYRVGRDGTSVTALSDRASRRGGSSTRGLWLVFRTKTETAEFVNAGEAQGFSFEGKEYLS
jgi:hypothetical protein